MDERKVTLISSGTELSLAVEAQEELEREHGVPTAVVSLISWELFEQQPAHYREEVLSPGSLRVGIEAGSDFGWRRWLREDGHFIGVGDQFGASAPAEQLYEHFGITKDAIVVGPRPALRPSQLCPRRDPTLRIFTQSAALRCCARRAGAGAGVGAGAGDAAPAFWTPPDALRDLGVDWALTLQQAVADWNPDSVLVVDASEAPGFALQALEQGLKAAFMPEDDPAFADLNSAAVRLGASLLTRRPAMQAHWTPALPRSRRRGLASAAPHPN